GRATGGAQATGLRRHLPRLGAVLDGCRDLPPAARRGEGTPPEPLLAVPRAASDARGLGGRLPARPDPPLLHLPRGRRPALLARPSSCARREHLAPDRARRLAILAAHRAGDIPAVGGKTADVLHLHGYLDADRPGLLPAVSDRRGRLSPGPGEETGPGLPRRFALDRPGSYPHWLLVGLRTLSAPRAGLRLPGRGRTPRLPTSLHGLCCPLEQEQQPGDSVRLLVHQPVSAV